MSLIMSKLEYARHEAMVEEERDAVSRMQLRQMQMREGGNGEKRHRRVGCWRLPVMDQISEEMLLSSTLILTIFRND